MAVELEALRAVADFLAGNSRHPVVLAALEEIEGYRAAHAGRAIGRWAPIKDAPLDGRPLLLACVNWPLTTRFGEPVPMKLGGWDVESGRWYIFGASWVPTHYMLLPDAPDLDPVIPAPNATAPSSLQ